jgi:hypothetical protein
MKVKIGNKIYDSIEEPIMLIFDDDEQRKAVAKHLTDMNEKNDVRKYAIFKDGLSDDEIKKFMSI